MTPPKRPRDTNQLAKSIIDLATGNAPAPKPEPPEYTRRGGEKGGKSRAEKMSPERRAEIAKKAAETRWKKK